MVFGLTHVTWQPKTWCYLCDGKYWGHFIPENQRSLVFVPPCDHVLPYNPDQVHFLLIYNQIKAKKKLKLQKKLIIDHLKNLHTKDHLHRNWSVCNQCELNLTSNNSSSELCWFLISYLCKSRPVLWWKKIYWIWSQLVL